MEAAVTTDATKPSDGGRKEPPAFVLSGDESSPRTLRVRFGAFVSDLIRLGEPDEGHLADLLAGADLLLALDGETDRFGSAAPGVDDSAPFTEKLLAITDGAFMAAHEILGDQGWNAGDGPLHGRTAATNAVYTLMDEDLHRAVAKALLACPPEEAADPSMSEEFV